MTLKRVKKLIKKLNPIDDIVFRTLSKKREFCEEILREFLQDPTLKVLENYSQYPLTNVENRSVVLDAYCVLKDGRNINVEVQNLNNTDHQKRVRYYSSMLTTSLMKKGEDFNNIPKICMIYICNFDIFHQNRSIYLVKRIIDGTDIELDNGLDEIYISANVNDGSKLAELMEVFTKDDCYSVNFPVISKLKYDFKNVKGENMTGNLKEIYGELVKEVEKVELAKAREEGLEDGIKRGIQTGIERGRKEGLKAGIINTLIELVKDGLLNLKDAAIKADMSVEQFKKLLKE